MKTLTKFHRVFFGKSSTVSPCFLEKQRQRVTQIPDSGREHGVSNKGDLNMLNDRTLMGKRLYLDVPLKVRINGFPWFSSV